MRGTFVLGHHAFSVLTNFPKINEKCCGTGRIVEWNGRNFGPRRHTWGFFHLWHGTNGSKKFKIPRLFQLSWIFISMVLAKVPLRIFEWFLFFFFLLLKFYIHHCTVLGNEKKKSLSGKEWYQQTKLGSPGSVHYIRTWTYQRQGHFGTISCTCRLSQNNHFKMLPTNDLQSISSSELPSQWSTQSTILNCWNFANKVLYRTLKLLYGK